MMNNRITRIVANTVGLAAIAALGITVYQIGTSPVKENSPEESVQEETGDFESGEDSMIDVGTDQVEAEMEMQGTDNLTGQNEDTDENNDMSGFGTSDAEDTRQDTDDNNVQIQETGMEDHT